MRYTKLLLKNPFLFLVLTFLMSINSFGAVISPFLWGQAIASIFNKESNFFFLILGIYAGVVIIRELNSLIILRLEGYYYTGITKRLRTYIFNTIINMSPRNIFLEHHTLFSLFINDANLIRAGIESVNFLTQTLTIILITLTIMFSIAPIPSLVIVITILMCFYLPILLRNKSRILNNKWVKSIGENVGVTKNILDGYQVYRLNRGEGFAKTYSNVIKESMFGVIKRLLKLVKLNLLTSFFAFLPNLISLLTTSAFAFYGYLSISTFMAINSYISLLAARIFFATFHINQIINGSAILRKMRDSWASYGKLKVESFALLEIRNVSISFEDKNVISDFSLKVKPGKKYLLIGKSGSGKSSLVQAMLGLLQPTSGEIFWNNQNLIEVDPKSLLEFVYVISSSDRIIEATLRENITMFEEKVTGISIKEAIDFLAITHLDNKETINSELISSGESQRVLLARFLVRPRSILILDEALGNLDKTNRKKIEQLLLSTPHLTFIHITHQEINQNLYDKVIDLNSWEEKNNV